MRFRKKKLGAQQLESILNSLAYNEITWAARQEHSRDEFLEIVYDRMKRVLNGSLNEMLKISYYGKLFNEGAKTLSEWLDDDNIDTDAIDGLKGSISGLIGHYTNLANVLEIRNSIKGIDGDVVYLTYDPPPEAEGLADVVYVYLDREVYDSINKYIGKAVKVDDDIDGMFL